LQWFNGCQKIFKRCQRTSAAQVAGEEGLFFLCVDNRLLLDGPGFGNKAIHKVSQASSVFGSLPIVMSMIGRSS